MLKNISAFFFVLFFAIQASAQIDVVMLVKGRIKDNETSRGVKSDLTFTDNTGKKVYSKSDAEGTYQAVLKPGTPYTVKIAQEDFSTYEQSFTTPAATSYTELTLDIGVRTTLVSDTAVKPSKKTKKKKSKKGKK